jgi:hypothetical protein
MVACLKSSKHRKVFDVKKARVQGTDLEKYASKPSVVDLKVKLINYSH